VVLSQLKLERELSRLLELCDVVLVLIEQVLDLRQR